MVAISDKMAYLLNRMNPAAMQAKLGTIIQSLQNSAGVDITTITGAVTFSAGKVASIAAAAIDYTKLDQNTKRFTIQIRLPADAAAGTDVERALFYAPVAVKVIDIGIVPDAGFGQATDYAALALEDKGTDGLGTTAIASKNFNSSNTVAACDYASLGTVANADIAAGHVLSLARTHAGNGQIIPACNVVLTLERAA